MKLLHFTIITAIAAALAGCGHKDSPGERAGGTPPGDISTPTPAVEPAGTVAFTVKQAALATTEVTAQIPAGGAEIMYFSLSAVDGQPVTATLSAFSVPVGPDGRATVQVSEKGAAGRTYTLSASTVAPVFPGPLAAISDFFASPAHASGAFVGNVQLTTAVQRWSQSLTTDPGLAGYTFVAAPAATGTGLVCFAGNERDAAWNNYLAIGCRDAATGNVVWSLSPDSSRPLADYHALAADASGVYVGVAPNRVEARSLADGSLLWSAKIAGYTVYGVAAGVDGVFAFVLSSSAVPYVAKLDKATGGVLWQVSVAVPGAPTAAMGVVSVTGGYVYALGRLDSSQSTLIRLSTDGGVLWRRIIPVGSGMMVPPSANSEGVYLEGVVYSPSVSTLLQKYALNDGALVWEKPLTSSLASAGAFATDFGIFAMNGPAIEKYDYDGQLVWSAMPPGSPSASAYITMSGSQIYYATVTGTLGRLDDL